MKLKYYLNEKQEKIYTLKNLDPSKKETKDAHYKYIKIKGFKD
jgi:hypothetical protein